MSNLTEERLEVAIKALAENGAHFLEHTSHLIVGVHAPQACAGRHCPIHNPSDHAMRSFPQHWRMDRYMMERICPHGIGHPDPDHMAYIRKVFPPAVADAEAVHGCDGCCKES